MHNERIPSTCPVNTALSELFSKSHIFIVESASPVTYHLLVISSNAIALIHPWCAPANVLNNFHSAAGNLPVRVQLIL